MVMRDMGIRVISLGAVLLVFACLPIDAYASEDDDDTAHGDSGRVAHQLSFDFKPGAILHTNEFLRGSNPEARTMNHDMGFHVKYAFSLPSGSREARVYRDAYQGIGIAYNEYNWQLGNPVSVYLLQGARIASLCERVALNYEWNFGLAMGWHPYDAIDNPDNKVIGSRVTAYMGLDLYLRWVLSRHVDVNFGLGVAHYSNGNTQFPNLGLNTASLRIGTSYYIHRDTPRLLHRHESLPQVEHHLTYDLILYGAWRQRGSYTDGIAYALPGKSAVFGFNFNPMYSLNHWLKVGASLDGVYDRSANLIVSDIYDVDDMEYARPAAARQMALGLSARTEFVMPYFSINFGVGTNVINAQGDFIGVYESLALKMNVTRRAILHIGYSLNNFHSPKHLMLGVGWRFGHI